MTLPPSDPSYDSPAEITYDPSAPATLPPVAMGRGSAEPTGDEVGDWVARNGRALGASAVVLAVAVAGVFAWQSANRASAGRAERALYEAEARFGQGDPAAAGALQGVVRRYGDTPAGAHARVLLAQSYYDQQKYADGLRVLSQGSVPEVWQGPTDRLRAVGELGVGRPKQAAAIYERLAGSAGPETKASVLGDAARAYEAAGATVDAKRLWQRVIDTGVAGAADEARVRLGALEARRS